MPTRLHSNFSPFSDMARLFALASLLSLPACNSNPTPTPQQAQPQVVNNDFNFADTPGSTATPDDIFNADPSAIRLGDIGTQLLLYVRVNHQMPPALDHLNPPDATSPIPLTSPTNNQPYVYIPGGLWLTGHPQEIVVYDPAVVTVKTSAGKAVQERWCLFKGAVSPSGAFSVDVFAMPEAGFEKYKPANGQ